LYMQLKPLSNKVFVETAEEEPQKTKSGIVLPETAEKDKFLKGTVTAVGPGKLTDKGERLLMSVKVGDRILFKKPWSGDELEADGKKFLVIDEDDVLAVLE
jgi:chaperonin GroES